VLCGVNQHPDGDWATVAVATHPGGFVRSAVVPDATASAERFSVRCGDGVLEADETSLRVHLDDARVDLSFDRLVRWPLALGGGGLLSMLPFLGQYWHPHLLGGRVQGTVLAGEHAWVVHGADLYAEKNWGAGFPSRWWWGQAQGFDRPDVCVAFSGGVLTAGPFARTVGGAVVRVGAHVLRFAPPFARVASRVGDDRWEVVARSRTATVRISAVGRGEALVLPVPVPAERHNADTDRQHLAGELELEVTGRVHYSGISYLAGLEVGYRPDAVQLSS
jgi:tocopherol cyclase